MGPVKDVDTPPKGVMAEEEPPNGVRAWLRFTAAELEEDAGP